jgi:dTDP-4-amino-4,6-dideoxygalactose transaminase
LRIEQRRKNYQVYKDALSHLEGVAFLPEPEGLFSNRWLTCLTLDPTENGGISRERIRLSLETENIESRPLWKPMHKQPVFSSYQMVGGQISESLFDTGLCLPSGSNLTQDDLERVIRNILKCFKK